MVITMDVKGVRLRGQHAAPLAPTMTMIGPATGTIGVLAQSSANLRDGKASSGGTGARHIWLLHTPPSLCMSSGFYVKHAGKIAITCTVNLSTDLLEVP